MLCDDAGDDTHFHAPIFPVSLRLFANNALPSRAQALCAAHNDIRAAQALRDG
jgi:hypothetical protein